eukprot:1160897-Pelagomonas_calceolata.AAC.12
MHALGSSLVKTRHLGNVGITLGVPAGHKIWTGSLSGCSHWTAGCSTRWHALVSTPGQVSSSTHGLCAPGLFLAANTIDTTISERCRLQGHHLFQELEHAGPKDDGGDLPAGCL